ncbi:arginine N-methyltransferase, putative [Trypanosoma equiperdum]|uniref:Arginine N-methyltransferase, putative n=1 Tax=Trypanosoma equiperdum TaxID=5694 RepID=A0A1G4HZ09_TRYEQ|nr:arginine N-methyltransferase, putative [Trypanosoma equiperdum]
MILLKKGGEDDYEVYVRSIRTDEIFGTRAGLKGVKIEMSPKKNSASRPSNNGGGGKTGGGNDNVSHRTDNEQSGNNLSERIIANESLLATESERHATSKSLYGDCTARISGNLSYIHDRVRLRAYESVLRSIKGKSVLHLGCGMGLVSMIAARSLASAVVAVDRSAIVDAAQVVAKKNGLNNISFFRGALVDVVQNFPVRQFDVIICEWMGPFLINDPLLEEALYARNNLLASNGVMCPDSSSIHVVGVSDYCFHMDTVEFWGNVYGFKMEPMKALVQREVEMCRVPTSSIVTTTCLAHTVNIASINNLDDKSSLNDFVVPFSVRATKDTTVNFLTFYIDARFTNPHDPGANFVLGVRPGGTNPWTETSVALHEPLPLKGGEVLSGELKVCLLNPTRGITTVEVTARTSGNVVNIETKGTYNYQRY